MLLFGPVSTVEDALKVSKSVEEIRILTPVMLAPAFHECRGERLSSLVGLERA
jgi:hypothetical protein